MRKFAIHLSVVYTLLCILVISCQNGTDSDESDMDPATSLHTTEQYFEGNFSYSPNAAFLEESISGTIIPVDMTGLAFMIETEYPRIDEKKGEPIYIKLSGYLAPQQNEKGAEEMHLTIKKIKEIKSRKQSIQPMTGVYHGDNRTLTVSADHTYTLEEKNGIINEGYWYLRSENAMILRSPHSRVVLKVNHKKKSLNGRDDNPTIFMLSSTLSSR